MSTRTGICLLLLLSAGGPAPVLRAGRGGNPVPPTHSRAIPIQRFRPTIRYCQQLLERSRLDEARFLMREALATARQARIASLVGESYQQLGQLETIGGDKIRAIGYYLQALAIYQTTHAYDQQRRICYKLSGEYYSLQNEAKGREYHQMARQLAREHPQNALLDLTFSEEAIEADQRENRDSVLLMLRKVLMVCRATRQWTNYYSYLDGYGVDLGRAGRYQEAVQTFLRCLAYARRQGDLRRLKYEYLHLPEPLLHLGRLEEAQRYAKLALRRIDRDPERQNEHRTSVYDVLTRIAEARGQYRQALAYERLRSEYDGKVQNAEKSRQVAEVESRFQVARKQARINRLDQDNRRQLNQISWQTGGLLALLALLALAGWQYIQIRRVNARLQATNQTVSDNNYQISEQADRLAVLMRELHHRVKNNLAIVSSLLRMQSKRLDDPRAVQAVQDGQRRVEAISLIHQQFYQTENLAEVSIKAYVTELTEGLLLGYGFDPESFDCRIEVADLQLDVEVAVPLGLILNEVLTNAFKYAYADPGATDPEGRVLRGRSRPSLLVRLQPDPTGGLLVEVQDNGPGFFNCGANGPESVLRAATDSGTDWPVGGEMSLTNRQGTYFRLWIPTAA